MSKKKIKEKVLEIIKKSRNKDLKNFKRTGIPLVHEINVVNLTIQETAKQIFDEMSEILLANPDSQEFLESSLEELKKKWLQK